MAASRCSGSSDCAIVCLSLEMCCSPTHTTTRLSPSCSTTSMVRCCRRSAARADLSMRLTPELERSTTCYSLSILDLSWTYLLQGWALSAGCEAKTRRRDRALRVRRPVPPHCQHPPPLIPTVSVISQAQVPLPRSLGIPRYHETATTRKRFFVRKY